MILSLTCIACGLCFYIIPLWAFRKGLKDGIAIASGAQTIEPIKTPLQVIEQRKEAKATKAAEDKIAEGMANIFAYDGTKQRGGEET